MDPADRRRVHEIVAQWLAMLRSSRLYGREHHTVEELVERFHEILQGYLADRGVLEVELDREGAKWNGVTLVRTDETRGDALFRLFSDGIRLITFERGVTPEEIQKIVCAYTVDTEGMEFSDHDTATLLWQESLPHIQIAVVDAFLRFARHRPGEEGEHLMEDTESCVERIRRQDPPALPTGLVPSDESISLQGIAPIPPEAGSIALPSYTEIREGALSHLLSILLLNVQAVDPELKRRAMETFYTILHLVLRAADLDPIIRMLDAIQKQSSELLEPFINKLHDPQILQQLSEALENQHEWKERTLAFFLNRLNSEGAQEMVMNLLKWKGENAVRGQSVVKTFLTFHDEIVLELTTRIYADTWKTFESLVRDLPVWPEVKKRILTHPHPVVRTRALELSEDLSADLLSAFLWDESETVRFAALERIGAENRADLLDDLQVGILQKEFDSKEPREKEKWYIITALVGRDAALSFFMEMFERRSLLEIAAGDDRQVLAARALAVIGALEALPLLEKEAERKMNPPVLRQACREAVAHIRRKTGTFHGREPS
ncbi:MAG TPA: hypothetical protein PK014_12280 [Thermoanaerobaculia bacterium]|nr:hypothetical protein [Thermoanaerobaculia bacterium]HUM30842.1 hypothetical protein [Thermoanaerobaculia bacterium]HXK69177.1 hypothetical protein [Thermoanaerobaculia bacterium]